MLATATLPVSAPQDYVFDFSAQNILLQSGQPYTIKVAAAAATSSNYLIAYYSNTNPYPNGYFIWNNNNDNAKDFAFEIVQSETTGWAPLN